METAMKLLNMFSSHEGAGKIKDEKDRGYRQKYMEHVQHRFRLMKDLNARLGENVLLDHRYTKLIIVEDCLHKDLREQDVMAWGSAKIGKGQKRSISMVDFFKADEDGQTPQIVLLVGPAAIGKTMTAKKIMLDWASERLYQKKFEYSFYISCWTLNLGSEQASIVDLILKNCPSERPPIEYMLTHPEKLLFLIDGVDELRFLLDQPESNLCSDPWQKKPIAATLSSLFRKKVLRESYLIITTRPTGLEKLWQCLGQARYAEILGFAEPQRKEYFHKYFNDAEEANQAFHLVKDEKMLFTICFVPLVCWIVCTVMKQQMEREEDIAQTAKTMTGTYMLYLFCLLKAHRRHSSPAVHATLKGLCSLATDQICRQNILFGAEEMKKHGLETSDSLFLSENIFQKGANCECLYSFVHLSFQEFLAALFYVLEKEEFATKEFEIKRKHVKKMLADYGKTRNYLMLTVRFLFGLLNEERMKDLEKKLSYRFSPKIKSDLLEWIRTKPRTLSLFLESYGVLASGPYRALLPLTQTLEKTYQFEEFHCLYEIQEESFVRSALSQVTYINVTHRILTKIDQVVLSFCLRHAPKLESLGLKSCEFQFGDLYDFPRQQKQVPLDPRLSPIYLLCQALKDPSCNLKTLKLWWCSLTGAGYKDLANVLCSPRLAELELGGDNSLEDTSVQQLCKGLKHPSCRLRRLRLWSCRLTGACCGDLASVLISNMHLTELDLRGNLGLGDHGMQKLCDGLRHPRCMLQRLRLRYCSLTAMSCLELAQVLSTSQALQELDLGRNKLGLNGMKLLCKGLMHASCRLKTLVLRECSLRADSCHEMALALGHPCALVELDLQDNQLGMAGVEELCQGLRQPGCQLQTLWLSPHTVTEEMWPDLRTIKEAKPGLVIKSHE
ncbi:NACHT, LRR and PYD domains-containing protein 12 [Alligator mississippiensis]|uniref:NACHT, LRR and PYD domains-containing protein 12 n=1 Tax=Alligator mississippiensis TaxID=8496 RepID=UPI000711486C|nr:NACHT, LRR and PYD domains-containing protein 12 [Alligator mississippiensis]XP_059588473.1 NACHT, LRR and PYD domains-containing protein 12 [Alligator mississippiensis]